MFNKRYPCLIYYIFVYQENQQSKGANKQPLRA